MPKNKSGRRLEFRLQDGTPIGQVKIGRLRSRIAALHAEARLLEAISNYVAGADGLATIAESISEPRLAKAVAECLHERSKTPMPDH